MQITSTDGEQKMKIWRVRVEMQNYKFYSTVLSANLLSKKLAFRGSRRVKRRI